MLYRYINDKWLTLNHPVPEVRVDNKTNLTDWCTCVLVWTNYQPYDDVKSFGAVSDFSQADEGFDQSINVLTFSTELWITMLSFRKKWGESYSADVKII